jgi:hypothetical protein
VHGAVDLDPGGQACLLGHRLLFSQQKVVRTVTRTDISVNGAAIRVPPTVIRGTLAA